MKSSLTIGAQFMKVQQKVTFESKTIQVLAIIRQIICHASRITRLAVVITFDLKITIFFSSREISQRKRKSFKSYIKY
jgi:hypothetical protein